MGVFGPVLYHNFCIGLRLLGLQSQLSQSMPLSTFSSCMSSVGPGRARGTTNSDLVIALSMSGLM